MPASHRLMLPDDIARCAGVWYPEPEAEDGIDWREGCEDCQRRVAPWPLDRKALWCIEPEPILVFSCAFQIPPETEP